MKQSTIKISTEKMLLVASIKNITGVPMFRFIEEAIELKVSKLPKNVREKLASING